LIVVNIAAPIISIPPGDTVTPKGVFFNNYCGILKILASSWPYHHDLAATHIEPLGILRWVFKNHDNLKTPLYLLTISTVFTKKEKEAKRKKKRLLLLWNNLGLILWNLFYP